MDENEGQTANAGNEGEGEPSEAVDTSVEAIEARMAELGHTGDDEGEGEGEKPAAKPEKKAKAKPDTEGEGEGEDDTEAKAKDGAEDDEKPGDDATDEEKKSWQAKMKAEVEAERSKVKTYEKKLAEADARDAEWVKAANETIIELHDAQKEIAHLRAKLKQAGIEDDPQETRVRELERELAKIKGGSTLQQQLAQERAKQEAIAAAQTEKVRVQSEANALITKYVELKDATVAEEILTTWAAVASLAEQRGKTPPTMGEFVKKEITRRRLEKAQTQTSANKERGNGRKAPRTLQANGSSAVPSKFPATDEGIEAWAKSRGYDS